jgi:alpha,alpha-trehalose phosphorylase
MERREVIRDEAYAVEPWSVPERALPTGLLASSESIFALSNGHIGLRGNLDEGEPFGIPGTYLNGFFELHPLPYAETAYGFPESGQTLVNVTNGKLVRLLVDDEPFDVRYGELRSHERVLDLREGVLRRTVEWSSPAGRGVRITSTRIVSFSQRAIAAVLYEVEPLDEGVRVVVQSELVANETVPVPDRDPRAAAALAQPLRPEWHGSHEQAVLLAHSTKLSGLRMVAAMDHVFEGAEEIAVHSESGEDVARVTATATLKPGEKLRLVKFLAYAWSGVRSFPALRAQAAAALAEAKVTGWDDICKAQREYLDDFWATADVEVEGDAGLQQTLRFALFQLLQAGGRAELRAIPSKGLTGPGYDGHTFWDSETFVLQPLTYTAPKVVRDVLRWRHSTLDLARARAATLNLRGAVFPWRTIRGEECSGYWPAGTAAFHIGADIADAAIRYVAVSGDEEFERDYGVELLVETARMWRSLGHHDAAGAFRIDGVTGPDEYSAIDDNNVYTNLMSQQNMRCAAELIERYPERALALGVTAEEAASWRDAATAMLLPYNEALAVHEQAEAFTEHAVWDFESTRPDQYPLLLHFPYFDLYRKQVIKQADLVLAMHLRGNAFSAEEKERNFAYYEALTVRDSSLSAPTQAVIAAEVGHLRLAYAYLRECAQIDLQDLALNTHEGLHLAALAGTWIATVAGFGGLRDHDGKITFAPRLPPALSSLVFRLLIRGTTLRVDVNHERAGYTVLSGEPLSLSHHGNEFRVGRGSPVQHTIPPITPGPEPKQPPSRPPGLHREGDSHEGGVH